MSIVKNYVDLMHGRIRVRSAPGKGTEFTIDLPIREGGKETAEPVQHPDQQLKGKHILLCEDNRMMEVMAMVRMLF